MTTNKHSSLLWCSSVMGKDFYNIDSRTLRHQMVRGPSAQPCWPFLVFWPLWPWCTIKTVAIVIFNLIIYWIKKFCMAFWFFFTSLHWLTLKALQLRKIIDIQDFSKQAWLFKLQKTENFLVLTRSAAFENTNII